MENTNFLQKKSSKIDYSCPTCCEHIEINEQRLSECKKCDRDFFIITCFYCNNFIFYDREVTNKLVVGGKNLFDSYTIQCPYINCSKLMCFIQCPQCNKRLFLKSKYLQGDKIKCPNCKVIFVRFKCPHKTCKEFNNIDLSVETYKLGQIFRCSHDNGFSYQKISCSFCNKHNIFIGDNKYIDGQKIICANDKCKKQFNKLSCPHCYTEIIYDNGNLELGEKIKCLNPICKYRYTIIFCPKCKHVQYNNYVKPGELQYFTCTDCECDFQFINCLYCKTPHFYLNTYTNDDDLEMTNIFSSSIIPNPNGNKVKANYYMMGQRFQCSACQNNSAIIVCPSCNKSNKFPKGFTILGKAYKCKSCNKPFTLYYCKKCKKTKVNTFENGDTCLECGDKLTCMQCPKCLEFIEHNENLENLSYSKCKHCDTFFYYYKCCYCLRGFIELSPNNMSIKCACPDCQQTFSTFRCSSCWKINDVMENDMHVEHEFICKFCGSNNTDITNDKYKVFVESALLPYYQPTAFNYNQPQCDPFDLYLEEFFIKSEEYKDPMRNKKIQEIKAINFKKFETKNTELTNENMCVICYERKKESVFIPCGHRCVCVECGVKYKQSNNRCPICKEAFEEILERVYD